MVRETRHLWVGNLPENIREDRIRDHFKRYGRVQSVKLLPRAKDDEGSGVCATVSFMDIKSASKAHNNEQKLEDRALSTEYHEPAAIPGGSAAPIYASPRFSHGPPEEISSFERSSHFYERERERREGDAYLRRPASNYHVAPTEPLRGRTRDRLYRNGPYTPIIESVVSRQPQHHRSVGSSWSYEAPASRYPTASTTPDVVYPEERREPSAVVVLHKKHKSRSGSNGSESGSNSGSSGSRSRSSSSSSQSASSSCSSASSSPVSDKSCSTHSHHGSLRSGVTLQSAVSTPHTNNSSPAVHSDDRRPLAICVRNLPARSSDTSLKDGLFHEYKKHGKVTWVKVVGQGAERYALVCFKKPEDVEKALQVSHDKLFFGCKIEVGPYQGYDVDDNEFRPYEAEQDEFHPKATRTLFIGNLEKDITAPELRKHFDQFGEIIEIDIKKQGSASSYAFCQYCDIGSVVRAMRTLDGEHLGNNRIKLGFGKSMHTNCVWVDGVSESVSEKYLSLQFSQFGPVSHVAIDRSRGHALVFYEQIAFAQLAVKEMRGVALRGRKLQVDFASRECQEAFYDHLEKQTGHTSVFENSVQASPQAIVNAVTATARGFETPSSSSSSSGGGGSTRYNATSLRYTPQQPTPRSTALYPRAPSNSGASPGASTPSPSTPIRTTPRHQMTSRFEFTNDYTTERRPYRSYEDVGLDDGGGLVMVTVGQGPPDIRHLQKERNALLEQLEDCASSGEEGGPRRRCKHRRSHSGEGGGGGSRPGTPLCDERPENLPPLEPRRTPRERPPDPLSLPLPRFASQVLSPRPAPPSPPASPPRPQSSSSDDSEPSPPSPEWEERLRSLDEKYEKWSGSRTALTKVDASALRFRHKLLDLDLHELQPSDIVKSVLAKRSVFDEDSKRLENFGEKYEPREFIPSRPGIAAIRSRLDSSSPLHSPVPKSPASSPAGGAKGLQYPFPSHPPVQPTTSVATTTAAISLVSCAGIGISAVTTATSTIPSIEISKASQTYPTSCITTVATVRQFPLPSLSNYLPPKISPPPPSDKKVETTETSPRGLIISSEKICKSVQKSPSPSCIKWEKCESMKKEVICSKQIKPCSRRESTGESTEERKDGDGRRRSREETVEVKPNNLVKEVGSDKTRDAELCERRKSVSDRRRDSVDGSQKENSESVCVSDKSRDSNHKEERRRRDSVDNSARRDSESSETCKSRLSELRRDCSSEQSDTFDCSRLTCVDSVNKPNERRRDSDDNTRHSVNTDFVDKKKESFVTYSERDRRRARESVDSCSDNSRSRKVPESIDKNKELETDLRHNEISLHEKKDEETKKITEHQDRRKDVVHNDNIRNNEISDRRREKESSEVSQENVRHRERKEHSYKKDKEMLEHLENVRHKRKSPEILESTRHKENDRRKSVIPIIHDNSRHRDTNARKDSESSEDHSQKSIEHNKKESDYGFNSRHRDNLRRKETEISDLSISLQIKKELDYHSKKDFDNNQSKKDFEQIENLRHKDHSHKKDIENQSNIRNRDFDKKKESEYYDNSRQKDNEKTKESEILNLFQVKEVEIKKECDNFETNKSTSFEIKKEVETTDHSSHKDSEKQNELNTENSKTKFDERKQDSDGLDVRLKEFDAKKKDSDVSEISKHRESEKKKDNENEDKFWNSERRKGTDNVEIFKTKEHKNSEIKKDADNIDIGKMSEFDRRKDRLSENCRYIEKRKELENVEVKREDKRRDFEIPDPLRHRENDRKKLENSENSKYLDRKKENDISDIFRRKELEKKKDDNGIDNLRFRDSERRKDLDSQESIRHRDLSEKRRESSDKERRKERESLDVNSEVQRSRESADDRRKERESDREKLEKPRRNKEYENQEKQKDSLIESSDKRKETSDNCERKQFDSSEKRTEVSSIEDVERKTESIKKEKRKDRISSSSWPAAIGCKRRLSSQDSLDICIDEAKRVKPERRDSKDSGRSSCSSSKRSSGEKHNKTFNKMLEEKIKEDREREFHRKKKEEEVNIEDKGIKPLPRKEKRNSSEKRKEERKPKSRPRENGTTASESELGSGDDEGKLSKRHSIFDIVDDEPAYISMYDKVKARSTKNMQKQEEEKRQERLKEKFSQLKQCRAKREEKKRSTSYDEDSDSERGAGRRSNKLMITSSEEDGGSEGDTRTKPRKIMSDTSEDDIHRHSITRIKPLRIHSEDIEPKPRKIMSDTSEDDTLRLSISRIKSSRLHSEDLETKPRKILSDTSEDDMLRHNVSRNKTSRIHSDESEVDMGFEDQSKVTDSHPKVMNDSVTDLFSNVSEDNEQLPETQSLQNPKSPASSSLHRNSIDSNTASSEIPRKKSHKKKQKRQKSNEGGEDGFSSKRHISKKDRRKSTHSHDGEEDGKSSQGKIRKKRSDRESAATKRDEKMEDIFGTLSDDSDKGQAKWQVSQVYGSDSDSDREATRKRDKRRKERKARELDEAGRALEAKLLETSDNYPQQEEQQMTKTKKKKRKKSRDEKSSKHHQLRLEEEAALAAEADSEREPEPPVLQQSLPRLIDSPPPPTSSQSKKPDIPGFGSQVDENIHETAVKSISESPTKIIEEKTKPIEPILPAQPEDKPTPVISQEETEDAVAALLLEDSFGGGFEGYPTEETQKPDTPISEPDLQIDTDTEDTFDPIDFSRPPRTPDIPSSFYRPDTREGLEERILALACPDASSKSEVAKSIEASSNIENHESQTFQKEVKIVSVDNNKKVISSLHMQQESSNLHNERPSSVNLTHQTSETGKRHDLPPLVRDNEISHVVHPVKHPISEIKTVHMPCETKLTTSKPQVVEQQPILKPLVMTATTKPFISTNPPPLTQRKLDNIKVSNATTNVRYTTCVTLKPASVMAPLKVNVQPQPLFQSQIIHQTNIVKQSSPNQQAKLSPLPQQPKLNPTVIQGSKVNAQHQHQVQLKVTPQVAQQHSPKLSPLSQESPKNNVPQTQLGQNINIKVNSVPHSQQSNISFSHERHHVVKSPKPLSINIQQGEKSNASHPSPQLPAASIVTQSQSPNINYVQNQQSNIHVTSKQQHQQSNIHVTSKQQNLQSNVHVISNEHQKPSTISQVESSNVSQIQQSNLTYGKSVGGPQHGNSNVSNSELPTKIVVPGDQQCQKIIVPEPSKIVVSNSEQSKPASEKTSLFISQGEKVKDVKEQLSNVSYSQHSHINCIDKSVNISQPSNLNTPYVSKPPETIHQGVKVPMSISQQHSNALNPDMSELKSNLSHSHEQKTALQQSQPQKFTILPIQNCVLTTHAQILKPNVQSIKPQTANISVPTVQNINTIKPPVISVSKPNTIVSSCEQPVKTVISQSITSPQMSVVPIQQVIQKTNAVPFVKEMVRPPNAPQPQVVHTLRNDMMAEKPKGDAGKQQVPQTIMSHVIQPTGLGEEGISLVSAKKDTDEIQKKYVALENHLEPEPIKVVQVENKITKPTIDEVKPMNAFIQDLTLKATIAKQTNLVSGKFEEEMKKEILKPIEQVVKQIHERIRSSNSESKDVEKLKTNEQTSVDLKEEIKAEAEIKTEQASDGETQEEISKIVVDDKLEVDLVIKTEKNHEQSHEVHLKENISTCVNIEDEESQKVDTKNSVTTTEEPKVDKIIIKKEDTGMCVDAVVAPLTPKMEKSNVFVSPGESSCEPKEQEMATFEKQPDIQVPEIKEEIVSPEETIVTPVRTGRGGRKRKAGGRTGGVVTRRSRLNNKTVTTNISVTADVYEFRDDSEEESRPRLILTIKSPPEPSIVQSTSPANNTRKSRRLQEKDGSRNTVDDTIEDVIRGTRNSGRRTTRAAAAASSAPSAAMETRRSPRRKQAHPPLSKELLNDVKVPQLDTPQEAVLCVPQIPSSQPPTTITVTLPSAPQLTTMAQKTSPAVPTEPMTLIDPVTGLLIPMRESEEGQYIPVSSDHVRNLSETHDDNGEPAEKRMKTSSFSESVITSDAKPIASPLPLVSTAPTPLPIRPGLPVKMPPNCAVVTPLPSKINPNIIKPNNLSEIIRPVLQQSKPITPLPTAAKPMVPIRTSTTIVAPTGLTKPLTVTPTSMVKPTSGPIVSSSGGKPSPHINSPIPLNRVVVPPPLAPTNKPIVCQPQATGTTISTVPLNHKTHLLQAVSHRGKVPIAKVPTPLTPKAHILQSIGNVANCGAREGVVGPGTPPPPHHGALLTGSVASPPLRAPHHVSQQPIVTGASSSRVVCKSLLEPLKVEAGAPGNAGCIVVPTPSPQPRGQVMQAGLPVPAYEASLGDVVQHVSYAPHPALNYVHSQLMYQQYQQYALGGYHLPSGVKPGVDIEEGARGAGASPPLELRRGSPHDRTTDSPQVATLYVHGARHLYYEGPHPPPAHRPSQPRIQVSTPPHASQVPPQADSLLMLLQRYPVMWQGLLALKTDQAAVQMHFVFGNPHVARDSLPCNSDGSTPPLRIVQRMRLEQTQVDGVARKMQMDNEHCMLLALPCGRDHMDVLQQSNNLQNGFITYLQQKQAAGIVNIAGPGSKQAAYVVHIFPACDFANESLARIAPDLLHRVADIAHLLIVIATV